MAMNEDMSLPEPSHNVPRSMIRGGVPSAPLGAEWITAPAIGDDRQSGGMDATSYLHALRRRWLVAVTVGTLFALAAAAAVWFLYLPEYTAEYYLKVSETEQRVLGETAGPTGKFDTYKRTQQATMKDPDVLEAALRPVAHLDIVKRQDRDDNAVWWLRRELDVDFPGDAEIMRVSLKDKNEEEVKEVVTAVATEYLARFDKDQTRVRADRLDTLDKKKRKTEIDLRRMRDDLRGLERELGAVDTNTLPLVQQNKLRELFEYQRELSNVHLQFMLAGGQPGNAPQDGVKEEAVAETVEEADAVEEGAEEEEITVADYELDLEGRRDPLTMTLMQRTMQLETELEQIAGMTKSGVVSKYQDRYSTELETVENQLLVRRETLSKEILDRKLASADFEKRERELEKRKSDLEKQVLEIHMDQLRDAISKIEQELNDLEGPTVNVVMLRQETEILDNVVGDLASEIEKMKIEQDSGKRVVGMSDQAFARCTNGHIRLALTILAGAFGFVLPIVSIVFWDTQGHRVNSPGEVSGELGLDVIGEVPVIPNRAVRNLVGSSPRYHRWHAMLTESVDGIAARLLRQAESDPIRVIMVSSAVGGEGKTTVATQLALSLARTGRRTVLVDFDLRQPSLDGVFGIPVQPGVGELLKHETELPDAVHGGQSGALSVITAGVWKSGSVEVLANGSTSALFEKLRSEYDFVIVDGSPILPVVDTRFISQHVDGVVLSVLRDVSRVPKVAAACGILEAFSVRILGAVVTGGSQEIYYRDSRYLRSQPV